MEEVEKEEMGKAWIGVGDKQHGRLMFREMEQHMPILIGSYNDKQLHELMTSGFRRAHPSCFYLQ